MFGMQSWKSFIYFEHDMVHSLKCLAKINLRKVCITMCGHVEALMGGVSHLEHLNSFLVVLYTGDVYSSFYLMWAVCAYIQLSRSGRRRVYAIHMPFLYAFMKMFFLWLLDYWEVYNCFFLLNRELYQGISLDLRSNPHLYKLKTFQESRYWYRINYTYF